MSVADFEVPPRGSSGEEEGGGEGLPEPITKLNRPVYLVVIIGLFVTLLFGLVSWFVLTLQGLAMPEGMAVLIGTVGGGLVGLVTTSRGT
ncbi:hypothetical protein ASF40_16915 [Microbacterium sp. Leaf288]|uniref:hypothetical protein n=1 Tax=Microbacterium sp. Leaf288 TaxID=1736323 RepID=UPI0006FC132A|nr:hypothetical protein [Microbacterium sp. Leaf288]KQP69540.1 hypothetical protein ASF40_16915 [Microbacterium sp. Leaf288]